MAKVDTVSHVVLCLSAFYFFRLYGDFPAAQRIVFTYAKERQITVYFGSVHRGAQLQWSVIQSILLMVHVLSKKREQRVQLEWHNNELIPSPVPIPTFVVKKQFIIALTIGHIDNHTFRSPYP